MEQPVEILVPNPRHVVMPSKQDLDDALVMDVGRWSPRRCVVCAGTRVFTGLVPGTVDRVQRYVCNCEEQLTLWRWFRVRGLSDTGMRIRWADMTGADPSWISAATGFLEHLSGNLRNGTNLVFHGRNGSGKSSIAALIAKAALYQNRSVYVLSMASVGRDTFASMWKERERYDRVMGKALGADLLMVEELGRENDGPSKATADEINRLIAARAENSRSTLITTNMDVAGLTVRYGEAMDLLHSGVVLEMSLTESWRDTHLPTQRQFEIEHDVARPVVWG